MNEKIFLGRMQLKGDSLENWLSANPVLLENEVAIVTVPAESGAVAQEPAILFEVGDGTTDFKGLPFVSGKAADVYDWAKAAAKPSYTAEEIVGLADYIAGEIDDTDTQYKLEQDHWGSSSSPYNTNYGGWAACDIRYDILGSTDKAPTPYGSTKTTSATGQDPSAACATNPVANTLMAALPADLRAVMQPMTKYTDNKGNSSNVAANVTKTIDYLPLLSEFEIFGARSYANQYEKDYQAQYAYYSAGNSKVKYRHSSTGSTADWWERSPYYNGSFGFCYVNTNGVASLYSSDSSYGLAPAFKI